MKFFENVEIQFLLFFVFYFPFSDDSDTLSLILVVCFFIVCNFTALLVNFLELTLYEQLSHVIVYLVDLSNLLVVVNCTANFFLYLIFGNSFRQSLYKIMAGRPPLKQANLLWPEDETNYVTRQLSNNDEVMSNNITL